MILEQHPSLLTLSESEMVDLADELMARAEKHQREFPVRDDHVALLEKRFAEYRADPASASAWTEVRKRFERTRR